MYYLSLPEHLYSVSEALALKQRMQPDMDIGLNLTKMVSEALALKQRMQLIIMSTVYVATLCLRGTCAETEDATLYQKLLK